MPPHIYLIRLFLFVFCIFISGFAAPTLAQKLPPTVAAADKLVRDGQALIQKSDFNGALSKFADADRAANAIPLLAPRLFYQVESRLGSATALDALKRYEEALVHADWASQTVNAQQTPLPATLKAATHHIHGVILYHLNRTGDAKAMFDQAAKEGDKTAANWQQAISAPSISTKPVDLVALAEAEMQRDQPNEALVLYVMALEQSDLLGDKTALVMQRAIDAALRVKPLPPGHSDGVERLKAADAALRIGAQSELERARNLLRMSVIKVPWWSDGWKRLADVEERLNNLPAARIAFGFYLKAAPQAPDRSAIEQRVASLDQRIGPGTVAADLPRTATVAFDGTWSIIETCAAADGALPYAKSLVAQVSAGTFHAETGVKGQPDWLSLDGKIAADGTVVAHGSGLTGDRKITAGGLDPGTPYSFDLDGHIVGTSGSAKRHSRRDCQFAFTRQ